jgi:hypothetical protein
MPVPRLARPALRPALHTAALLAAVAALVLPSAAAHAAAPVTTPTVVTADASPAAVVVGGSVTVTGQVVDSSLEARTLNLEIQTANGWRRVGGGSTDTTGAYSLPVPTDWYGKHVLRVVAPATDDTDQGVSPNQAVTVSPDYTPRGSAKAWKTYDRRPRWDPCRVIPVRTNLRRAPAGTRKLVKRALSVVHAATGLRFNLAGSTTKVPFTGGATSTQFLDRGLVIAWTTPRKVRRLAGSVAGVGGSTWRSVNGGPAEYQYGGVAVDATQKLPAKGFAAGQSTGALLLHEIAHTVGLDHVGATSQLMYPQLQNTFKARFEAGDLAGLRAVGASRGCL